MEGTSGTDVSSLDEAMAWQSPGDATRIMGVIFERDITGTDQMAAGFVRIPEGGEQPKLSRHQGEEVYFVVNGTGRFEREGRADVVTARGAVYVRPFEPHRWVNVGQGDLEVLWVDSPPAFGRVGGYEDIVKDWTRVQ